MNMKKIARWFGIGVAALLAFGLTLPSCAMEGQVLEEGTNKPLAGVIVIATWHGSKLNPVHSISTCFHLETATTDKNGKFKMPSFSGNFDPFIVDRNRYLDVYKAGYQQSANPAPSERPRCCLSRIGAR